MTRLGRMARIVARDAIGLIGAASISYGAWLIYRPAGFIIAGAFCVVFAVFSARAAE